MNKVKILCDCDIIHKDKVKATQSKMLDAESALLIADFYKALSDSTRIKMIDALFCGELCVCDLSYLINMTKSATSHQLRYLKDMNLVKSRRQGKEVFYSLEDEHVKKVFAISVEHIKEKIYE